MYHVELRHFPRSLWRFNLSGQEVGAILEPWVQERVVELGDQKWSPHQATITIIEGSEIPLDQVSMGRGGRAVKREGRDVTDQVLAEARQKFAPDEQARAPGSRSAADPSAVGEAAASGGDPVALAMQVGSLLGPRAQALLQAWSSVAGRAPGLAPSESLAIAEQELAESPAGQEHRPGR